MAKLVSTHQPATPAAMLLTTQILACRARVGCLLPRLNAAASCIILVPSSSIRRPCSSSSRAAAATVTAAAAPSVPLSFADRPGVWDSDSSRLQLKCLTFEELEEWCASMGEFRHQPPPAWEHAVCCQHTAQQDGSASFRRLLFISITWQHCRHGCTHCRHSTTQAMTPGRLSCCGKQCTRTVAGCAASARQTPHQQQQQQQ